LQDVPIGINEISKFIVRGNTLVINYVDETDNGRYVCHAFNNYDQNGQKKEYLLNVISKNKSVCLLLQMSNRIFSTTCSCTDSTNRNEYG
jgi:membrane protease subunit (stomatin/prohibitin family)